MENRLILGDAETVLKEMEENSIDLVVTSPPYDNLRKYNGSGDSWNHEKFKAIAKELYRVMKDGGVIVWVVNDKTEKGSKTGTSFKQALYFMEIGFNLNDTMIWCLSGGTYLYVKTNNGVSSMMIKDIVKLKTNDVHLWNGSKWVNVVGWKENTDTRTKIRIQLRSGQNIYCTKEHRWVLENGQEVLASNLKIGDVLKSCSLPDENLHNPLILTKDILWLIGLYLAEGSHSEDTIQISLCSDEIGWVSRIRSAIESVGGTITYTLKNKTLNIRCYSKIFNAILSQYTSGKTSKDKHLNSICWQLPNNSLKEIVNGYLDGDGGFDEKNNRWRLGFTENKYLERDLRTLAARLNAKLTLLRKGSRIKSLNKIYPSLKGEWRWNRTGHYNEKPMHEIMLITEEKMQKSDKMWDIEVDCEDHLFALSSGVLTHNCKTNPMPQIKQPRYSSKFEYMFVFSKGKPKTFNPIIRPCKCAGMFYNSTGKNMDGESGRHKLTYNVNDEMVDYNVWEIAIAQNKTGHPAVFPYEIAKRHILSWSNEGDVVLDPFMGSGTTILAAIDLKRKYVGIEFEVEYYDITKKRIEEKFAQ